MPLHLWALLYCSCYSSALMHNADVQNPVLAFCTCLRQADTSLACLCSYTLRGLHSIPLCCNTASCTAPLSKNAVHAISTPVLLSCTNISSCCYITEQTSKGEISDHLLCGQQVVNFLVCLLVLSVHCWPSKFCSHHSKMREYQLQPWDG